MSRPLTGDCPRGPLSNPGVALREDGDDWAVLLDPETGSTFGLSPVGLLIWECLDGMHSMDDIVEELRKRVEDLPNGASSDVTEFVDRLIQKGLAGFESVGARGKDPR
jgi:SynChlorMet cassette protein ScmD